MSELDAARAKKLAKATGIPSSAGIRCCTWIARQRGYQQGWVANQYRAKFEFGREGCILIAVPAGFGSLELGPLPQDQVRQVAEGRGMNEALRDRARGRWHGLLPSLGVDSRYLTGKHTGCPICREGSDRFRFDDKGGAGTWICSAAAPATESAS